MFFLINSPEADDFISLDQPQEMVLAGIPSTSAKMKVSADKCYSTFPSCIPAESSMIWPVLQGAIRKGTRGTGAQASRTTALVSNSFCGSVDSSLQIQKDVTQNVQVTTHF